MVLLRHSKKDLDFWLIPQTSSSFPWSSTGTHRPGFLDNTHICSKVSPVRTETHGPCQSRSPTGILEPVRSLSLRCPLSFFSRTVPHSHPTRHTIVLLLTYWWNRTHPPPYRILRSKCVAGGAYRSAPVHNGPSSGPWTVTFRVGLLLTVTPELGSLTAPRKTPKDEQFRSMCLICVSVRTLTPRVRFCTKTTQCHIKGRR